MNTSARETIIQGFSTALANALVANGYSFDLGASIFRGLHQVPTVPSLSVFDGIASIVEVPRVHRHTMPVVVEGHVSAASTNVAANAILADIIQAVNTNFSVAGVVLNLTSYGVAHTEDVVDTASASVTYTVIFHTSRTDPLTILEV